MRRIEILAVVVIFVESKYILAKDMIYIVEEYSFPRLPIAKGERDTTEKIVLSMYKDNIQIRKEGDLFVFHKIDLLLL